MDCPSLGRRKFERGGKRGKKRKCWHHCREGDALNNYTGCGREMLQKKEGCCSEEATSNISVPTSN